MIGLRAFATLFAAIVIGAPAFAQTATTTTATTQANTPKPQLLSGVAAIVNDEVISISDVGQRARLLLLTLGLPASEDNLKQALPRSLEELIDEKLQLQKAKEYDLEVSDKDIEADISRIAQQNKTTLEGLYTQLRGVGVNPETLKDQTRAEIAWRRIMSGLYGSRIRISKLQIDGMLDRLKSDASETRYQLSEIFLYAPTDQDKQKVLTGANVIVQQLRQGARFQLAAQQYSNAPSAAVGGDLGWVSPAELDDAAKTALAEMTPPSLSGPIVVDDGVYIYALRAKQDGVKGAKDVALKQLLATEASKDLLNFTDANTPKCDDLEKFAQDNEGLSYADLGRVPESALTPQIQTAISGIESGQPTAILDTPNGPAKLFVCDRGQTGLQLPTRDQIEDRLYSQQIALISERDLRNLKREATIIRR